MKQKFRYKENEKFSGAIKKDKYVLALDLNEDWKLAQILEVRYAIPYDNDAQFWDTAPASGAAEADGNDNSTQGA